jgi:hypothetical protein
MHETAALLFAVHRLAERVRALPESALRRGAGAEGLTLARELVRRAQAAEFPGSVPRELPDAGLFAVGDQLAVAGNDLAEALRVLEARDDAGRVEAETEAAEAVRLVEAASTRVLEAARGRRSDLGGSGSDVWRV